jgi:hypothetical protein
VSAALKRRVNRLDPGLQWSPDGCPRQHEADVLLDPGQAVPPGPRCPKCGAVHALVVEECVIIEPVC